MPHIGDIKYASVLGFRWKSDNKYQWVACEDCGKERWVSIWLLSKGKSRTCYGCRHTGGAKIANCRIGKGGIHLSTGGYAVVTLTSKDSFFYPMTFEWKQVYEHRLVMARHLGRCIAPEEQVHHINEDKRDNRLENLQLMTVGEHSREHKLRQLYKRERIKA